MPPKADHRTVTPFVSAMRAFFRGRGYTNALRFADCLAARNQPPPDVPGGPYHKTSKIYYYTRDARREVTRPTVIPIGKQIAAGKEASTALKQVTPSKIYMPQ